MRVEIITLHSVANYGTQLQALATQKKLSEYFDDVEFIDFRRSDTYGIGLFKTFSRENFLRGLASLPTLLIWHFKFGFFQKKYLNLSEKKYLNEDGLKMFNERADYYVVGSDQVWNTGWNHGVIPAYYLNFIDDSKPKFSFSSSFGMNHLEEKDVPFVKKYLRGFKCISVREPSGVDIVKNQLGLNNVVQLVDPVLSLPASYWRKMGSDIDTSQKYILVYSLNRNKNLDDFAVKISKKTGFKLIRFCTRVDQILRPGKGLVIPNILDFITLIDNAECVITDSFHATAFSMLMNTPPICVYPEKYSNRISEFLKLVDENERHLKDYEDFDIINRRVDFKKVNSILERERNRVDVYLEKAIDGQDGVKQ